jgi:hypothetical protein
VLQWFNKAHPVLAAIIKKTIGYPISSILTTIDLIQNCKSLGFAIGASIIFAVFNH